MKNIISILVAVLLSVSSVIAQNNNIVCIKDLLNSPSNNPVPTTMGLNEVYVTLSGDLLTPSEIVAPRLKFSRNFMFTPQVKFIIQPYENQFGNISIYNTFNTLFGTVLPPYTSFNLEIDFQDGKGFQLVSPLGMTYTANYVGSEGKKSIEARTKLINSFGIGVPGKSSNFEFTAKKAIKPYEKPSAIWEVNLQNSIYLTASNGKFVPPSYAAAAYNSGAASNPNDPFYKYLNPSSGKAHIYIKYGKNSDGSVRTKLMRPAIFIDGIDLNESTFIDPTMTGEQKIVRHGAIGWDVLVSGTNDLWKADNDTENFREFPQTFTDMTNNGYDVLFVDFEDGSDFIQKQSLILIEVIKRINLEKDFIPNPSNDPLLQNKKYENVIIGASMGGQVAKHALSFMEKNNDPHCTRLYVSFDSPHQGANIPLSLQAAAWYASEAGLFTDLWNKLSRPAAKQLLVEHFSEAVNKGRIKIEPGLISEPINAILPANPLRSAIVQEMQELGYPKSTQNIAVACGSQTGLKQTLDDGDYLFSESVTKPSLYTFVHFELLALNAEKNVLDAANKASNQCANGNWHFSLEENNKSIFKGISPLCLDTKNKCLTYKSVRVKTNHNYPHFDNAPGCQRSDLAYYGFLAEKNQFDLKAGVTILGILDILPINLSINFDNQKFHPTTTFMPTVSLLDVKNPNDPNEWNWSVNDNALTKNIFKAINSNSKIIPFFDYFAPNENLRHVEINPEMRTWFNTFLKDSQEDATLITGKLDGKEYNFGYRKNRICGLEVVSNGGILRVNNKKKTGFDNEAIADRKEFELIVTSNCNGYKLDIKNNGKCYLGNEVTTESAQGNLRIVRGGEVNVGVNGLLKSIKNSKIFVDVKGVFNSNGGLTQITEASEIAVKKDGLLNNNGGKVEFNSTSQLIIENGGKTYLNAGTTELRDNSKVIVQLGGELSIFSNALVNLKDKSLIIIQSGGEMNIFSNASVYLNENSQIVVEKGGILRIKSGGGTFHLNQYAQIIVKPGGSMIIEDGTDAITFDGNNGADNPVKIEGELNVAAPINFKGNAYFDFHQGHLLTLNSTFYVTGDGHKMMNIRENCFLYLRNQDIAFATGRINYNNNTRVVLPKKRSADFANVHFDGSSKIDNTIGITNENEISPSNLHFNECRFNQLNIDILLDNKDKDDSPESFLIENCQFLDYHTVGIMASYGKNIIGVNSYFHTDNLFKQTLKELSNLPKSKTPPAMSLQNFGYDAEKPIQSVAFYACRFVGNNAANFKKWYDKKTTKGGSFLGNYQFDPFFEAEYSYEIYLNDVPNFTMAEGTIVDNAFSGILADEGTNINLLTDTKFIDNGIGIKMNGAPSDDFLANPAYGRLTMDCANMVNNAIGITGENIWLNIDEYILGKGQNQNTFDQYIGSTDKGRFFDIKYSFSAKSFIKKLYPSGKVAATFNHWLPNLPVSGEDYNLGGTQTNLDLDISPASFGSTKNCEILHEKQYNLGDLGDASSEFAKGIMTLNGAEQAITPIFWTGMSSYLAGNMTNAKEVLKPIAAIDYKEKDEIENHFIQQMIDVSKTIVYASKGKGGFESKIQKYPSNVKIYPNPVTDQINISLPKGNFDISIFDVQGRSLKHFTSQNEENMIDTKDWLSGIYQIVLKNNATGETNTYKIVVVKR